MWSLTWDHTIAYLPHHIDMGSHNRTSPASHWYAESPPFLNDMISPPPPVVASSRQRLIKAAGIYAPMVGHVGDGNFHMMMVLDTSNRYDPLSVD